MTASRSLLTLVTLLFGLACLAGCGSGAPAPSPEPFDIGPPPAPPSGSTPPTTPPPTPTTRPAFDADAFQHHRAVPFGAFPSDIVVFDDTVFTTDADQVTREGLSVVPIDVSSEAPTASTRFVPTLVLPADLVDSWGQGADADLPIGFGYFANDLVVMHGGLAALLVSAGGSDTVPTLSNLLVFDPTSGTVLQTVDLANPYPALTGATDSVGLPVPSGGFLQSGAEGLAFVPTSEDAGRLYVAMANLVFAPPSSGTVRYPGTVQVFDVDFARAPPIQVVPDASLVTQTLDVGAYNPVAVTAFHGDYEGGVRLPPWRVLVTVAGATAYDAKFNLVPSTPASVVAYEGATGAYLGRFGLGLVGLSATRPALGRDVVGHHVGLFPSAVTGEIYLLRLDGLYSSAVDETQLAVLRGPHNGIPITPAQAGGPGGNITGVGLSPDGRTLVVAGFGDLFAGPTPLPGKVYLLNLPEDLVTGAEFGVDFLPGATLYGTVSGRTLGTLALLPNDGGRPDVYLAVNSPIDTTTWYATGPASLGTLQTFGLIR